MIATLVVTLGNTAETLVQAASRIMSKEVPVSVYCLDWDEAVDQAKSSLADRIKAVDQGQGVLVLTDIIGGTPHNISLPYAKPGHVEIISGVNLPMVVKAMSLPEKMTLSEAAQAVCRQTRQTIVVSPNRKDDAA